MLRALPLLLPLLFLIAAVPALATDPDEVPMEREEGPRGPVRAEEMQAMLEVLREMEPGLGQKIEQWKAENPDRVTSMLQRRFPRLRHLAYLRKTDRELYDLRVQEFRGNRGLVESVRAYRAAQLAKDPQAPAKLDALRGQLREQFELRQKLRRAELHRLEQRLDALRKEIADRDARRDRAIEDQLRHALRATPDDQKDDKKPAEKKADDKKDEPRQGDDNR